MKENFRKLLRRSTTLLASGAILLTAGIASAAIPPGYYDTVDTGSAAALRSTLNDVITAGHVKDTYDEVWTDLEIIDEDPGNSSNVLTIYANRTLAKTAHDTGFGGAAVWNREHTWPKSYGFDTESWPAYTDLHHMRASVASYNNARGNEWFDDCTVSCTSFPVDGSALENLSDSDSWEVWSLKQGDVARGMFYMDVRYAGEASNEPDLQLTDNTSLIQVGAPYMGKLSTILAWHNADAVDTGEEARNDAAYAIQGNRNPFIDHPEWVATLFAGGATPTPTATPTATPAPGSEVFFSEYIEGSSNNKALEIFNPSASAISMTDYSVLVYANGASAPTNTIALTGSVAAGDVFVIANTLAVAAILTQADQTSASINFNGNDAVVLKKNGTTVIDSSGQVGVDPGTEWGTGAVTTLNHTLIRKVTIYQGDANSGDAFDPATEWDGYAVDSFGDLGTHTYTAPTPTPSPTPSPTPTASPTPSDTPTATPSPIPGTPTDLILSEYVEGSSFNKALEVYNPTASTVDLSTYSVLIYANGGGTATATIPLTGTLAPATAYVLAHSSAVLGMTPDQLSGSLSFNGNDAVELFNNAARRAGLVDSIGQVGFDPGTEWGTGLVTTTDHTLRRMPSVVEGDTNSADVYDPATGWDGFAVDTFGGLGAHSVTTRVSGWYMYN